MRCDRPSLTVRRACAICEDLLRARAIALQAQLFECSQKTLSPSDARAKGDGRAAAQALPSQCANPSENAIKARGRNQENSLFALPKPLTLLQAIAKGFLAEHTLRTLTLHTKPPLPPVSNSTGSVRGSDSKSSSLRMERQRLCIL